MAAVALRALIAFLFLVLGSTFWTVGQLERRVGHAQRYLASLQYAEAVKEYDALEESLGVLGRVPWLGSRLLSDLRLNRATAQYWLTDYSSVALQRDVSGEPTEHDPELLFLAASTAFRRASLGGVSEEGARHRPPDRWLRGGLEDQSGTHRRGVQLRVPRSTACGGCPPGFGGRERRDR